MPNATNSYLKLHQIHCGIKKILHSIEMVDNSILVILKLHQFHWRKTNKKCNPFHDFVICFVDSDTFTKTVIAVYL